MDCNKPLPPLLLFFFFFFLLFFFTSFSQATGLDVLGGGTDAACLQKLLPCKDYVKSSSPPSSCCDPLKGIISTDTQCLCKVFNDPESLKSLGITQDDALGLAKTCGANPDVSACKTGSPNSNSTAIANTTTSSAPTSSVTKNGAPAVSSRGGISSSASIALWVAFSAVFYSH